MEKLHDQLNVNVLRHYYKAYYLYLTNSDSNQVNVQTMSAKELDRLCKDFDNKFENAPSNIIDFKEPLNKRNTR